MPDTTFNVPTNLKSGERSVAPRAFADRSLGRKMVLDVDHVLKEIAVGATATREQLTVDELRTLWATQNKFIEWALLAGKVRGIS